MWVRLLLGVALIALAACARKASLTAEEITLLEHSSDHVAVYDAGVSAWRAQDYATARRLWARAAELGDHEAASNLGFLLYYGHGGTADSATAIRYWRQAMAAGDAEAHRHVAQAIVDGNSKLGSPAEAYAHVLAAERLAEQPHEVDGEAVARDARALAAQIRGQLSSVERAAAESLAQRWSVKPSRAQ